MMAIWIVLGILILVLTPFVVGTFLPERYTANVRATYAKPPEQVWSALQDYDKHPMTGKMKKSVDPSPTSQDGQSLPSWVEDMGHGERITVTTTAADPPRHLVRDMQSAAVPMTSHWEYRLDPADSGCRVTLNAETFIRSGSWMVPIFRFMMVVGGGVRKGLVIQLNMIGESLGDKPRLQ